MTLIGCTCKSRKGLRGAVLIGLSIFLSWLAINDHKKNKTLVFGVPFGGPTEVGYKSGDYTEDVPPLPISNRVVKFLKANDIASARK